MKWLLAASTALALAACGGQSNTADNTTTTLEPSETAVVDEGMAANNMTMDNMAMGNSAGGAGSVTVTVNGVRANGGPVLVALQTESEFAKAQGRYTQSVQPSSTSVTATFSGVTPGTYAAAAVQDTNSDGTFNIGETGPTEPFGFSGSPQSGAPTFAPASFAASESGGTATVTLSGGR